MIEEYYRKRNLILDDKKLTIYNKSKLISKLHKQYFPNKDFKQSEKDYEELSYLKEYK